MLLSIALVIAAISVEVRMRIANAAETGGTSLYRSFSDSFGTQLGHEFVGATVVIDEAVVVEPGMQVVEFAIHKDGLGALAEVRSILMVELRAGSDKIRVGKELLHFF